MFTEQKMTWEQEMLIREAVECAEQGFYIQLKNAARVYVPANSPSIDLIIYGMEKSIRGNHERAQKTFIDFLYYWHEHLFKMVKRKSQYRH